MSLRDYLKIVQEEYEHGKPRYFMHLSPLSNLPSIKKRGLVPNYNGGNYDDMRWESLDGVYATTVIEVLERYIFAHGIRNYIICIIEVRNNTDVVPDEDLIDITLEHLYEKLAARNGIHTDEGPPYRGSGENDEDYLTDDDPFWKLLVNAFMKQVNAPPNTLPLVQELVEYWHDVTHNEGGDAVLSWKELKDKVVHAFPNMVHPTFGEQHSVRIKSVVGFEGDPKIVAIVKYANDTHETIYDNIPADGREQCKQLLDDLVF